MSFWHDHFGTACFVVALSGIAHFVAGSFWSRPFWQEFHEKNFFLLFSFSNFSIFLIYKNYFFCLFSFFQNLLKSFQYQIRLICEFSMNLCLLWKFSCKSIPEGYFQWSGSRTVKSDGAKLYAIWYWILPLNYFSLIYNFCEIIKELRQCLCADL